MEVPDYTEVAEKVLNTIVSYLDVGHSNFLQIDSVESIQALFNHSLHLIFIIQWLTSPQAWK